MLEEHGVFEQSREELRAKGVWRDVKQRRCALIFCWRAGFVKESKTPMVDVKDIKEPVATLQETLAEEGATSEAEAPFAEVRVTKEVEAGSIASKALAEEDQIVQEKLELPLVESESIAEAHGKALVIAEKSLPAEKPTETNAAKVAYGVELEVPATLEEVTVPSAEEETAPTPNIEEAEATPIVGEKVVERSVA